MFYWGNLASLEGSHGVVLKETEYCSIYLLEILGNILEPTKKINGIRKTSIKAFYRK